MGATDSRASRDGCSHHGRAATRRGGLGLALAGQAKSGWMGLAGFAGGRAASDHVAELGRAPLVGVAWAGMGTTARRFAGPSRAAGRRPDLGLASRGTARQRRADVGLTRARLIARTGFRVAPGVTARAIVGSARGCGRSAAPGCYTTRAAALGPRAILERTGRPLRAATGVHSDSPFLESPCRARLGSGLRGCFRAGGSPPAEHSRLGRCAGQRRAACHSRSGLGAARQSRDLPAARQHSMGRARGACGVGHTQDRGAGGAARSFVERAGGSGAGRGQAACRGWSAALERAPGAGLVRARCLCVRSPFDRR